MKKIDFWQAEMIRLTLFTIDSIPIDTMKGLNWIEQITGSMPDSQNSEPKIIRYEESGKINDNINLIISMQKDRIDFVIAPLINTNFSLSDVPNIGLFNSDLNAYIDLILELFPKIDFKIKRIAYGAKLFGKVIDKVDGYKKISSYVKDLKIDPINSYDLNYTINKPRQENIENQTMFINRLSKWAVLTRKLFAVHIDSLKEQETDTLHACSLELDVNTDQNSTQAIEKNMLKKISNKLANLAIEISQSGDIK